MFGALITDGYFGTAHDERLIIQPSIRTTEYPCAICINLSINNYWFSASSNFNYGWYIGGLSVLSLNLNTWGLPNGTIHVSNLSSSPILYGQLSSLLTINSNTLSNFTSDSLYTIGQANPSRIYDRFTAETTPFLSNTVYFTKLTINNSNSYGIGDHVIYSSSSLGTNTNFS